MMILKATRNKPLYSLQYIFWNIFLGLRHGFIVVVVFVVVVFFNQTSILVFADLAIFILFIWEQA